MNGILKDIQNDRQKAIDYIAALLVFTLPLSTALPNLLLIPLLLIFLINHKKIKQVKSYPMLFLGIAILSLSALAIYNQSFLDEFGLFSKYYLIPILFVLITQVKNKKPVEHALLFGVSIAILLSSIEIVIHIWDHPNFLLDSGKIVNDLLLLERPYFGFLLVLCVFICLKNAEKSGRSYDYYLLSLLFTGFSIYISARLSMGLIGSLFFIYLFKSAQIQRKTKIWLAMLMTLLLAISMGLSDNLMSRMHIKEDLSKTIHLIEVYEPRFVIWPCAIDIVQQENNFISGLKSYEKVETQLVQCYDQTIERQGKRHYYLEAKFNSHNQFLSFLLLGGIIPFLLLVAVFIQAFFSKKNSFELKLLFVLFLAFFLVENVLHRQLGCYLFGIFAALYSTKTNE